MNCMVCKEPMVVLEVEEVEVDHCLQCGGIWLDSNELELLLDNPAEVAAFHKQLADNDGVASKKKCPICRKRMQVITTGGENKISIDLCRNHHGLWFDRGELAQVIEAFDFDKSNKIPHLLKEMFGN